jgi:hypothetical protein
LVTLQLAKKVGQRAAGFVPFRAPQCPLALPSLCAQTRRAESGYEPVISAKQ